MDSSNKAYSPYHSPADPAFLLKSRQHTVNLAKLKTSIDSRQGITVVLGETGAGKTVLCRELAKEYSSDTATELLILPDPLFASAADFIASLAKLFGNYVPQKGLNVNQNKENVKKYLFAQCTAEKKSILILINRGDELPDFCLRIIEELYKFHIDAHKMLQVVLFGGKKLQKKIASFPDLATYVHGDHTQGAMTLTETREMIRLLLAQITSDKAVKIRFSLPAQWIIHRTAKGYPGRIINLCHLIQLTTALHNTTKADWYIAQMCAKMLYPEQAVKMQRIRIVGLTTVLLAAVLYGIGFDKPPQLSVRPQKKETIQTLQQPKPVQDTQQQSIETRPSTKTVKSAKPAVKPPDLKVQMPEVETPVAVPEVSTAIAIEPSPSPLESVSEETPPLQEETTIPEIKVASSLPLESSTVAAAVEEMPTVSTPTVPEQSAPAVPGIKLTTGIQPSDLLGEITIQKDETLGDMMRKLYGPQGFNNQNTMTVLEINPTITDPRRISIGDTIRFPALPVQLPPKADKTWWLQFAAFDNITDSYHFVRQHADTPPMFIIPTVTELGMLNFSVISQEYFIDEKSAQKTQKMLTPAIFAEVAVLEGLPPELYYYLASATAEPTPPTAEASASLPQLKPLATKISATAQKKEARSQIEFTQAQTLSDLSPSAIFGEITTQRHETLGDMIRKLYGPYSFNKPNTKIVLQVNPEIKAPSRISIGDTIRFPAIPVKLSLEADKVWWVQFAVFDNIADSYRFLGQYANTPPMLIIPAMNDQGQLQFHIIGQEYFTTEGDAQTAKKMLTPAIFSEISILSGLDKSKFYYVTE